MERKNITEMSFDEIFPEQEFPSPGSMSSIGQSELSEDDSIFDDNGQSFQDDHTIPDDRYASPAENTYERYPEPVLGSSSDFTENAYSYNEAARQAPPDGQISGAGNGAAAGNTYPAQPGYVPGDVWKTSFNEKAANYNASVNGIAGGTYSGKGLIFGVIALIFTMGGIGLIFAIIGLVSISKGAKQDQSDPKARSGMTTAKIICIFALAVNILALLITICQPYLPDILNTITGRII